MLQIIRSALGSIFVKALFVLLIASFAVWGVGDIFGGPAAGRAAVSVGDVRISTQTVADEFDRQRSQLGPQVTPQIAIQIGLLDRVLSQFATEAVLTVETDELGLGVGREQVGRYVREQFVDDLGNFNRAAYENFLFRTRQTEAQFVDRLMSELTRNQLIGALIADDTVPAAVVDRIYDYRETRRTARLLTIRPAALAAPEQPGGATLDTFYQDRKEDYREPEYRALTWVEIMPEAIAETIEIPEAEVRASYDDQILRFTTTGTRAVEQIFLVDQATAQSAYDRITGGEDFFAVAEDLAGMDADTAKLGTLTKADLPGGTEDAVFALSVGEVGTPVESDLGWHVFRVTERNDETVAPFDQVQDGLRRELALDQAVDQVFETANDFEDRLAGGATLEEAAAALNLPVVTTPAVTEAGLTPAGEPMDRTPGGNFLELAFSTEQGRQSPLGEAGDGFFVVRVDGIDASRIPQLSEITAEVEADWIADARQQQAEDLADEVAQKIRDGASLPYLAASQKLTLADTPAVTRAGDALPEGYPRSLAGALFEIDDIGGVTVVSGPDAVYVAQLSEIATPDGDGGEAIRAQITAELERSQRADVIDLLLADLEERYEVETDRDSVVSVFTIAEPQQ
ncbi:MAG: peptidyl-prolyl cis-trans isomerase [Alphaproteobacteria bacterium]|nr:peptidyl-prolyl cis-trans isomerase [Alphaproteobacteria bacterium]